MAYQPPYDLASGRSSDGYSAATHWHLNYYTAEALNDVVPPTSYYAFEYIPPITSTFKWKMQHRGIHRYDRGGLTIPRTVRHEMTAYVALRSPIPYLAYRLLSNVYTIANTHE